jgi:hypothetical protein
MSPSWTYGPGIEAAGCTPLLAHAAKAKVMMGNVHKTDKLDAKGLATLLYLGKLPAVWIAPGDIRDARELPRTRMAFSKSRASLKNRMHSTLAWSCPGMVDSKGLPDHAARPCVIS